MGLLDLLFVVACRACGTLADWLCRIFFGALAISALGDSVSFHNNSPCLWATSITKLKPPIRLFPFLYTNRSVRWGDFGVDRLNAFFTKQKNKSVDFTLH